MASFFQRVFKRWAGGSPLPDHQVASTPTAGHGSSGVADRRQEAPPAHAEPMGPVALGARRPLISAHGEVIGFEFRVPVATQQRLQRKTDHLAQAAHTAGVLASAKMVAQFGRTGLARLPAEWVPRDASVSAAPGMLIALESSSASPSEPWLTEVVAQMRASGARVGWDAQLGLSTVLPDFGVLRQDGATMGPLLAGASAQFEGNAPPLLLTDVASVEDIEMALSHGVAFVCGTLSASSTGAKEVDVVPMPPEVRRIGSLLNQLVTGAETEAIVTQIKGDVGLSYRLLKRINSASFAQLGAGATIEQAVMLMGRNELYRWLTVMLVQFADQRKASSALQEVALWRSRLLELMAIDRGEAVPGQLFTLGLASMLGLLLSITPQEVIDTLGLPPLAQQALLTQSGPWAPYLAMAAHLEELTLDAIPEWVEQFGGPERVLAMSDDAWAWAAQYTDKQAQASH